MGIFSSPCLSAISLASPLSKGTLKRLCSDITNQIVVETRFQLLQKSRPRLDSRIFFSFFFSHFSPWKHTNWSRKPTMGQHMLSVPAVKQCAPSSYSSLSAPRLTQDDRHESKTLPPPLNVYLRYFVAKGKKHPKDTVRVPSRPVTFFPLRRSRGICSDSYRRQKWWC